MGQVAAAAPKAQAGGGGGGAQPRVWHRRRLALPQEVNTSSWTPRQEGGEGGRGRGVRGRERGMRDEEEGG